MLTLLFLATVFGAKKPKMEYAYAGCTKARGCTATFTMPHSQRIQIVTTDFQSKTEYVTISQSGKSSVKCNPGKDSTHKWFTCPGKWAGGKPVSITSSVEVDISPYKPKGSSTSYYVYARYKVPVMTHKHVMTQVGVVKQLINTIKKSHSDADTSVAEVTTHAKSFANIQSVTLKDLMAVEKKLMMSKVKLQQASNKLKVENAKITKELAQLSKKWKKLNAQQSTKISKAEKKRASEMARLKKMTKDIQSV